MRPTDQPSRDIPEDARTVRVLVDRAGARLDPEITRPDWEMIGYFLDEASRRAHRIAAAERMSNHPVMETS